MGYRSVSDKFSDALKKVSEEQARYKFKKDASKKSFLSFLTEAQNTLDDPDFEPLRPQPESTETERSRIQTSEEPV